MSEPATIKRENLEALVIANDEFEKLEDAFDRFCPFEAMGVVRAEIRHGVYLSKMLSPSDPHGYGSKLLRALITKAVAGGAVQGITPMDVYLMELEDAEVSHQWVPSSDARVRTTQKSGQKRLDILINCGRLGSLLLLS